MLRQSKFKNIKKKNFLLYFVGFFIIFNLSLVSLLYQTPINTTARTESPLTTKLSSLTSGPVIGQPSLSTTNPNSNTSVQVTTGAYSSVGMKNVSLGYSYSYNSSSYSVNMSQSLATIANANTFTSSGTGPTNNYNYGNYTFVSSLTDPISVLTIDFTAANNNALTYLLVEGKNVTTGNWDTLYQNGTTSSTAGYSQFIYTNNNVTLGYKVYVLSYSINFYQSKAPRITTLLLQGMMYIATIPASYHPTFVNYNFVAYDTSNQKNQSPTYSFKMDYIPQIAFNSTSTHMYKNVDYKFNATVSDLDGATDINQNSVYASYYKVDPLINSSVKLSYISTLSSTMQLYSGTIPASYFSSYNGTITAILTGSDSLGSVGTSLPISLQIDTAGPIINSITFNGGVTVPLTNYVTPANYEPNITVQFKDGDGIQSASVYYGINGTNQFTQIKMINETLRSNVTTLTTFNATFPSYSTSKTIAFYFISQDYLSNVNTTNDFYYYVDHSAPYLYNYNLNPNVPYISNSTDTNVLFNVTEVSAVKSIRMFYSYNNGSTWNNNLASQINYNTYKVSSSSTYQTLPYNIPVGTSQIKLQMDQQRVDQASLKLGITFGQGSYLRIYLIGNGKSELLYDRVPGVLNNKIFIFDLFKLGFTKEDLKVNDFYLSIIDYSSNYFGQITAFQFNFVYYTIPLGYQWMSTIPMSVNNTIVQYYFNATDILNNTALTKTYSYYSDGKAPTIQSVSNLTQIDLTASKTIEVTAKVQDQGGVFDVELYYRFNQSDSYQIVSMKYNNTTQEYYYDIPVTQATGNVSYYIKAYDYVGFVTTSAIYNATFKTPVAQTTSSTNTTTTTSSSSHSSSSSNLVGTIFALLLGVVGIAVIGVVGVGGYILYKNDKLKFLKRKE